MNINPQRLIFTSGATEANNLGLVGHARSKAQLTGKPGHIITVSTEHHAVLDPLRKLQKKGFRLSELRPNKDGLRGNPSLITKAPIPLGPYIL